jgi:hypothetical protein
VGTIVDSLFADYLLPRQQEPLPVANVNQQTMLTNQMLTPVMNKPVMLSQEVPVFPSIGGIGGGFIPTEEEEEEEEEEAPVFASVGGIGGGVVPTEEEEEEEEEDYTTFSIRP